MKKFQGIENLTTTSSLYKNNSVRSHWGSVRGSKTSSRPTDNSKFKGGLPEKHASAHQCRPADRKF